MEGVAEVRLLSLFIRSPPYKLVCTGKFVPLPSCKGNIRSKISYLMHLQQSVTISGCLSCEKGTHSQSIQSTIVPTADFDPFMALCIVFPHLHYHSTITSIQAAFRGQAVFHVHSSERALTAICGGRKIRHPAVGRHHSVWLSLNQAVPGEKPPVGHWQPNNADYRY